MKRLSGNIVPTEQPQTAKKAKMQLHEDEFGEPEGLCLDNGFREGEEVHQVG